MQTKKLHSTFRKIGRIMQKAMQTVFTSDGEGLEPAREAHILLYGKLFFAILLPSIVYLLFWLLSIEVTLPVDQGSENMGLLYLLGITNIVQFLLVAVIVLQWKNHVYFFTEQSITQRKGLFTISEEAYDMKNVRNVTLQQGIFGRIFNFGQLVIHSSAPEFTEDIVIVGIAHPTTYLNFLKRFV